MNHTCLQSREWVTGAVTPTSASLTQIYRLPGTVFGHCICIHTFKLLHNCTCKQTAHTCTNDWGRFYSVGGWTLLCKMGPFSVTTAEFWINWWLTSSQLTLNELSFILLF